MAVPFEFDVRREDDLAIADIRGAIDAEAGRQLFGKVRNVVLAGERPCGLLYVPREPFSFEMAVVEQAKAVMKEIDHLVMRTAVVSDKTMVKFALSMVQLVTRVEVKSLTDLSEAKRWVLEKKQA